MIIVGFVAASWHVMFSGAAVSAADPDPIVLAELVIGACEQWMLDNAHGEATFERSVRGEAVGSIDATVNAVWSGPLRWYQFPRPLSGGRPGESVVTLIRGRTDCFVFRQEPDRSHLTITRGRPDMGVSNYADGLSAHEWLDTTIAHGESPLPTGLKRILARAQTVPGITLTASREGTRQTLRVYRNGHEARRLVLEDEFEGLPSSYLHDTESNFTVQTTWTWKRDQGVIVPVSVERRAEYPGEDLAPWTMRCSVTRWNLVDAVPERRFTQSSLAIPQGTNVLERSGTTFRTYRIGAEPPAPDRVETEMRGAIEAGKAGGFARETP